MDTACLFVAQRVRQACTSPSPPPDASGRSQSLRCFDRPAFQQLSRVLGASSLRNKADNGSQEQFPVTFEASTSTQACSLPYAAYADIQCEMNSQRTDLGDTLASAGLEATARFGDSTAASQPQSVLPCGETTRWTVRTLARRSSFSQIDRQESALVAK